MAWSPDNHTPINLALKKRKASEYDMTVDDKTALIFSDLAKICEQMGEGKMNAMAEGAFFGSIRECFAKTLYHCVVQPQPYCGQEDAIDILGILYSNTKWVKDNADTLVPVVQEIFETIKTKGLLPGAGAKGFHRVALAMWRFGGSGPFKKFLSEFPPEHKCELFHYCYTRLDLKKDHDKEILEEFLSMS